MSYIKSWSCYYSQKNTAVYLSLSGKRTDLGRDGFLRIGFPYLPERFPHLALDDSHITHIQPDKFLESTSQKRKLFYFSLSYFVDYIFPSGLCSCKYSNRATAQMGLDMAAL